MKPYPKVRQRQYRTLLWPSPDPRLDARDPRWTTQRAIGSPVFLARCLGNEELFPHLRKFKDLEAQKCPVPFYNLKLYRIELHFYARDWAEAGGN